MAAGYGVGFWEVAEWGYHELLIAEAGLDEIERVEGIRARDRALHLAKMIAFAMWKPDALADEQAEIARSSRLAPTTLSPETAQAVDEMVAFQERVARRQRKRVGNGG